MKEQGYIKLTKSTVKEMFDECNHSYFNDELDQPVKFETWTPSKKIVGMVRPFYDRKRKQIKAVFHISKRYRWTKENLRKVVVHEMIHLAINDYQEPLTFLQRLPLIGRFFITQHDERFISLMNEINNKYGLDITVRAKQMRKEFIR